VDKTITTLREQATKIENLQIGKIASLARTVDELQAKVDELRAENKELQENLNGEFSTSWDESEDKTDD
jgi:peptidoglycan hydrolase CwlO-like protein